MRDEPRDEHEIDRPIAGDLVGDVEIAALRVSDLARDAIIIARGRASVLAEFRLPEPKCDSSPPLG
jgi:hypothetical protein